MSLMQESGVLKRMLEIYGAKEDKVNVQRMLSMVPSADWPKVEEDYEHDAAEYIKLAEAREKKDKKDVRVPPDRVGQFSQGFEVVYDDKLGPYDAYMTKVDLKNGIYGDFVFYRMQLLFDRVRELYVVFTRWGRIGEDGMN